MDRYRGTGIDREEIRPRGDAFEPKKDCFGRDSFCMPEVRWLSALSMTSDDDPVYRRTSKPADRKTGTAPGTLTSRTGRIQP